MVYKQGYVYKQGCLCVDTCMVLQLLPLVRDELFESLPSEELEL